MMEGVENIAELFKELVPDLALTFPFELDNFQKEVGPYLLIHIYK